jgi:phosphomannomutase
LGAAAGIMVTASHNPAADNGYKVYLGTGAQIVPPWDEMITAAITEFDPVAVELSDPLSPLIEIVGGELVDEYLSFASSVRFNQGPCGVRVAYTALHGVGGDVARRAFAIAEVESVVVVDSQLEPDPAFPTVAFPNPEEPGSMDLVVELSRSTGADIALAHDPDADRLGVAVQLRAGDWRLLTGDEIGALLADHILRHTSGDDRLLVTTLVSSSLLGKMAAAEGVHFAETFTGFKWIADAVLKRPNLRLVFAYEQALGYLVAERPLDKDGVTASLVMAELAAELKAQGATIQDRLDEIATRFGLHVTAEASVRMEPHLGVQAVERLRETPPGEVGGRRVLAVEDYPEASLLRLWVEGREGSDRVRDRKSVV